jgi:hypothetical protein
VTFPPATVNAVSVVERVTQETRYQLLADPKTKRLPKEEVAERVKAAINKTIEQREATLAARDNRSRDLLGLEAAYGFDVLNTMLSTHLADGAEAWMAAQITGTWTAFETLAEALWEQALNVNPVGLADLSGGKRSGGKDEDKSVPLWMLSKHGYDLSAKMGTILKDKFSFDRLDDIRRAYEQARFDGDEEIATLIHDSSLDALSAVRNMIVHNGGIADSEYLSKRSCLPSGAIASLGEPVLFDGQLVSALIAPATQLGWTLIAAFDRWLSARGHGDSYIEESS